MLVWREGHVIDPRVQKCSVILFTDTHFLGVKVPGIEHDILHESIRRAPVNINADVMHQFKNPQINVCSARAGHHRLQCSTRQSQFPTQQCACLLMCTFHSSLLPLSSPLNHERLATPTLLL